MKYLGRVKVTGKRQITLPAEMCRDLGILEGDLLQVSRVAGEICLKPLPKIPPLAADDPIFDLVGAFGTEESTDVATDHDRWIADEAARHNA